MDPHPVKRVFISIYPSLCHFQNIEGKKPETALRLETDLGRCPTEIFVIFT